jgi:hypothetical protein
MCAAYEAIFPATRSLALPEGSVSPGGPDRPRSTGSGGVGVNLGALESDGEDLS